MAVALIGASVAQGNATRTVIRTGENQTYGQIVVGPAHYTLYVFCTGSGVMWCKGHPKSWRFRPLLARGDVVAARGSQINANKLGTKKLPNGQRQVTYYGQPLYRYKHDYEPGQTNGAYQDQGSGTWAPIRPDGKTFPPMTYGAN